MTCFLDIPPELITSILSYLSLPDLLSIRRTHSIVHDLTATSQVLQYPFAAKAAGVKDNPLTSHTTLERIRLLKSSEDGWAGPQFDFQQTISVKPGLLALRYDAASGIYFCTDEEKTTLYYCKLPSKATDVPKWSNIHVGRVVRDIGVSVHEHDLIALLTTTPHQTITGYQSAWVILLQFSTGEPHPLADNHELFVKDLGWTEYYHSCVQISGRHLSLSVGFTYFEYMVPRNKLIIYDWKSASLKLETFESFAAYLDPVFLSPNYILFPSNVKCSLDIWALNDLDPPVSGSDKKRLLSLALPPMATNQCMVKLTCHASSATFAGTPHSPHPFHTHADNRILVVNMSFRGISSRATIRYSLFVHTGAILDVVHRDGGASGSVPWSSWGPSITRFLRQPKGLESWKMVPAGQRCLVHSRRTVTTDSSGQQRTELRLLNFNQITVKSMLDKQTLSRSRPGVGISGSARLRLLLGARLAGGTTGLVKRFVQLLKLTSRDRRGARAMQTEEQDTAWEGQNVATFVLTEHGRLKRGAFTGESPVVSMLPYVSIPCRLDRVASDFGEIDIDEERVVTVLADDENRLRKLRVLHIGASNP